MESVPAHRLGGGRYAQKLLNRVAETNGLPGQTTTNIDQKLLDIVAATNGLPTKSGTSYEQSDYPAQSNYDYGNYYNQYNYDYYGYSGYPGYGPNQGYGQPPQHPVPPAQGQQMKFNASSPPPPPPGGQEPSTSRVSTSDGKLKSFYATSPRKSMFCVMLFVCLYLVD